MLIDLPVKLDSDGFEKTSGRFAALQTISEFNLCRVKDHWTAPGAPKVPSHMVSRLAKDGLISRQWVAGSIRLKLTVSGQRAFLKMMSESGITTKALAGIPVGGRMLAGGRKTRHIAE